MPDFKPLRGLRLETPIHADATPIAADGIGENSGVISHVQSQAHIRFTHRRQSAWHRRESAFKLVSP
jgi:hypothetical protein